MSYSEFCEHGCYHGNGCLRCAEDEAFWWGFTHPFSKPHFWWSRKRCIEWCEKHGKPWAS
jgi:hypothetical protein